jgi:hypothetical protein
VSADAVAATDLDAPKLPNDGSPKDGAAAKWADAELFDPEPAVNREDDHTCSARYMTIVLVNVCVCWQERTRVVATPACVPGSWNGDARICTPGDLEKKDSDNCFASALAVSVANAMSITDVGSAVALL